MKWTLEVFNIGQQTTQDLGSGLSRAIQLSRRFDSGDMHKR